MYNRFLPPPLSPLSSSLSPLHTHKHTQTLIKLCACVCVRARACVRACVWCMCVCVCVCVCACVCYTRLNTHAHTKGSTHAIPTFVLAGIDASYVDARLLRIGKVLSSAPLHTHTRGADGMGERARGRAESTRGPLATCSASVFATSSKTGSRRLQ